MSKSKRYKVWAKHIKNGDMTIQVDAKCELEAVEKVHGFYTNILINRMTNKQTFGNKVIVTKVREVKEE